VNRPFDHFVSRPVLGAPRVEFEGGLVVTVLGPRGDFSGFWVREVEDALRKRADGDIGMPELPGVLETCSSPDIFLQPSPVRIARLDVGRSQDRSERNRTSIVLLLEFARRTVLLTSDAAGDDLIRGLTETGLIDPQGCFGVDLLTLPHYGSRRNVDPTFFRTVKAPRYLVQCHPRHHLPSSETLAMLASARRGEPCVVHVNGELPDPRMAEGLALDIRDRPADAPALVIDLMADVDESSATETGGPGNAGRE
jgi:hypothetical protein